MVTNQDIHQHQDTPGSGSGKAARAQSEVKKEEKKSVICEGSGREAQEVKCTGQVFKPRDQRFSSSTESSFRHVYNIYFISF